MSADPSPPTIDFAAHVYPEWTLSDEEAAANPLFDLLGPSLRDPDTIARHYRDAGVDAAVLSTPEYMGHGDRQETARANDALHDVAAGHDEFYWLAAIPSAAGGEGAAEEFERCLDAGCNGGALETRSAGVELTDPELELVLAVADRTGAPLLVHPPLDDSIAPGALGEARFYNSIYGREVALATSLSDVIYEGILDQYPDLNLVFHHFGGNVASMLGRVYVHGDLARWPYKEGLLSHEAFEAGLERVYVDTSGYFDFTAPFAAAVTQFSTPQLLFATDFPFEARTGEDVRKYAEAVHGVADDAAAERILGANAFDLLVNV